MPERIKLATDPGTTGATVLCLMGVDYAVHNWKGEGDFVEIAEAMKEMAEVNEAEITWYVEHPPKTTGMKRPESTGFVLGENFGFIKGAIMASGIKMVLIRPQEWQAKVTGIKGKPYKERKDMCWEEAKRLFPSPHKVTKKNADAWLLLDYAITYKT